MCNKKFRRYSYYTLAKLIGTYYFTVAILIGYPNQSYFMI